MNTISWLEYQTIKDNLNYIENYLAKLEVKLEGHPLVQGRVWEAKYQIEMLLLELRHESILK